MAESAPSPKKSDPQFTTARNVYIVVFASFLILCIIAVTITNRIESQKKGFRAIETDKPMSFIDTTYTRKAEEN